MFASFRSRRVFDFAVTRYALAFTIAAIALLLCRLLAPFLPDHSPLTLLTLAIAFSAWYCGVGPSLVALTVAVVGARFATQPHPQWIALLAFFIVSVALIVMGEIRRRQNAVLRQGQAELEQRVEERTAELDIANHGLRELSARLMQLQDDERRRIARELHDGVAQELAYIVAESSGSLAAAAERALDESRRAIAALTRPVDEPLEVALVQAAEEVAGRVGVQLRIEVGRGAQVSPDEREALIRIVREAITNAGRHGGAENVSVELSNGNGTLLRIADDGSGFDTRHTRVGGFGLVSMRERTEALGGRFKLSSDAGEGTRIEVRLP
jgi:signal transduction histidine kinase